ncbi:hypothetical protein UACE39S_05794 [Ureibacillus acetophenoni]
MKYNKYSVNIFESKLAVTEKTSTVKVDVFLFI